MKNSLIGIKIKCRLPSFGYCVCSIVDWDETDCSSTCLGFSSADSNSLLWSSNILPITWRVVPCWITLNIRISSLAQNSYVLQSVKMHFSGSGGNWEASPILSYLYLNFYLQMFSKWQWNLKHFHTNSFTEQRADENRRIRVSGKWSSFILR